MLRKMRKLLQGRKFSVDKRRGSHASLDTVSRGGKTITNVLVERHPH